MIDLPDETSAVSGKRNSRFSPGVRFALLDPSMNCLRRTVRRILRSRGLPAIATVWYVLWSTGAVLAAGNSGDVAESSTPAPAKAVDPAQGESCSTGACCCAKTSHESKNCCCSKQSVPVPGLESWTNAPCGDDRDNGSIPETSRIAPHIAESALCVAAPEPGEFAEARILRPADLPFGGIDKVPLASAD